MEPCSYITNSKWSRLDWIDLQWRLKGPTQPHLCFCLHARIWLLNFIRRLSKRRKITVKLLKIIKILPGSQLAAKKLEFVSPSYINNFDVIENGGGSLGSFTVVKLKSYFACVFRVQGNSPFDGQCVYSKRASSRKDLLLQSESNKWSWGKW